MFAVIAIMVVIQLFVTFVPEPEDIDRRLVEAVMVLPGSKVDALDEMFMWAEFSTPEQRRAVLDKLLDITDPTDIREGSVHVLARSDARRQLMDRAKDRYRQQIERAGLGEFSTANLSSLRAGDPRTETVLLGLIVTRPAENGETFSGGKWETRDFLWSLTGSSSRGPLALYLYYAPDPGKTLSESAANRLLQRLGDV
ncbi:hypothetical protein KBTX_00617 [wastewater metagenome]|uniref:Uncharacterized protein n=4 Tax=root TaxID=1 RepID=A0A5B8R5Y3_9ZZZZ|nr:hypothetical protein KBTEX_00617 [uncultured organism]